jgi:AsmA protein
LRRRNRIRALGYPWLMKPLKYSLIGLAGLGVLVLIALAVISANFDAAKFKAEIARVVKDRTQRTLSIDGAIKLSFFPKIGVELGKLGLSERNSGKMFAAVDAAHVSVALLPLLSGQIVVDRVTIDGLKASLARRKDGSSNFDDLLAGGEAKGDKRASAAPGPKLDIAGVDLSNTELEWRDEAKKQHFAVKGLRLRTGRLADAVPSQFDLSMRLSGDQPKLDLQLSASGSLAVDAQAGRYQLAGLAATAKGSAAGVAVDKLEIQGAADFRPDAIAIDALALKFSGKHGADAISASLDIPKAHLSKDSVRAEKISAAMKLSQADRNLDARLTIPGMEGSGRAFRAGDLKLDLDGKQGNNTAKGSLASPISGNVEAQRYELGKLAGSVSITGPDLPRGAVAMSLSGNAALDLGRKTAQANLAARIDESNISAKLNLPQFSPPTLAFDLGIDQLNLDKYFPPKAEQTKREPDKPIDLSALKAVNASGSVRIGSLQVSRIKAASVSAQVRLVNGRLEMSPHSAQLYQGSVAGAFTADANGNRITLKENLSGVTVGPLLKDLADKDVLDGRGNVSLDLGSSGNSIGAWKKALNGTARIDLRDGAVKGINLAETLRKAKSVLDARGATEQVANKQEKTDFSELSASFAVSNGVAHNDDLSLKSPFLRLSGNGDINIGNDSMDYLAKVAVVASASGQGGKDLADLKGLTVPVRLSGPFDALKYRIDFGAMVGEVAKERAKDAVRNAIGEKLGVGGAKSDGHKADPKDQAQEVLRGLFKR